MATHRYNGYLFTLYEMSRKSQLDCAAEFRAWLDTAVDLTDLERVAAISTMVTLRSRLEVTGAAGRLPDGQHDLGDGACLTLPLTRACLDNDLPASLTGWLVEAAARENAYTLESFLAWVKQVTRKLSA
jgi:hypothetical protein